MTLEAGRRAIERIGEDPNNAYVSVFDEPVHRAGEGPLAGRSLAVKDNLALSGHSLTCASRTLAEHEAPYTATVVDRALDGGASVVAKANMDEFAAGSRGEHSAFGATENPSAADRVPGGSSSGCGAALAAGDVDLALGTDTGGSTRAPAAYCGVVALKPTNGRLSRWGLVDLAMSLDQPGPMARSVEDVARLYDALAGPDRRDPTTLDAEPEPALDRVQSADVDGTRIGVPDELPEGVDARVRERFEDALDALVGAGAERVPVELPDSEHALSVYYVTCYAEFASAMQKFDGTVFGAPGDESRELLGPEVKRRILLGTFVTAREERSAWYERALSARARMAERWRALFEDVDLVATPTMPTPPPERGEDPTALEEYAADVLTVHANLAGLPAGSVPAPALGEGPVGLQIVGPPRADASVLEAMAAYENERPSGAWGSNG